MNSDMGQLSALTIALALALDLLFLPTLLIQIGGGRTKKRTLTRDRRVLRDPAPAGREAS